MANSIGLKTAIVMAGGTGGHIFPALAIALALREKGWNVHWLGAPMSMESRVAKENGISLEEISFSGVRGKGFLRLMKLPVQLIIAVCRAMLILRRLRPQVVLGMGGYITVPGGLAAKVLRIPIFLHEQNAIVGMSNKILASFSTEVFTAFPKVVPKAKWVGNPLRAEFKAQLDPQNRLVDGNSNRSLRLLVMGGSQGAQALNKIIPQALALFSPDQRPKVLHQGGEKQIVQLQENYKNAGVDGQLVPFINDVAGEMAKADLVICRAGASTVCEVAAIGVAALFIPFPYAVDDHQTLNARYLADADAAMYCPQEKFTVNYLYDMLQKVKLSTLKTYAIRAKSIQKMNAVEEIVSSCEGLVS